VNGERLELQVFKGKSPTLAMKSAKSGRQVPQSTNVSSPVRAMARNKGKGKEVAYEDHDMEDEEGYGEEMGRGVTKPARRTYNPVLNEDTEEDDEDVFEPIPAARNKQHNQHARRELGAAISRDVRYDNTSLSELHESLIEGFMQQAKVLDSELRNRGGIKRAIFSETEYREMAIRWTTSVVRIGNIPGIDQSKVEKYGVKFAALVEHFQGQYQEVMAALGGPVVPDHDMEDSNTVENNEAGEDDKVVVFDIEKMDFSDLDLETSPHFDPPVIVEPTSEYYHPPNDPTLDPKAWREEYNRLKEESRQAAPERAEEGYERSKRKSEASRSAWRKKQGGGGYGRRSASAGGSRSASAGVTKRRSQGSRGGRAPARGRGAARNSNASNGIATMPH
jgi:bloom syndrome protein